MDRLGVGYDELKKRNPSLIFCSVTGYGQTGTYRERAGHDINYLALSGSESYSGRRDSGPAPAGIQIADIAGGSKNLCIALLAAYIRRLKTGEGDFIDISLTDGAFSITVFESAGALNGASLPEPESRLLNGGSMYDYYQTSDGRYLAAGPLEPKFFRNLYDALGMDFPDRLLTPEEVAAEKRKAAAIIASKDFAYWRAKFAAADACVEPVYTIPEAVSNPPLMEREMIARVACDNGKTYRQTANPLKFRSGVYQADRSVTTPGAHTAEILGRIGYSESEIARLAEDEVITIRG